MIELDEKRESPATMKSKAVVRIDACGHGPPAAQKLQFPSQPKPIRLPLTVILSVLPSFHHLDLQI